MLKLHRLEDRCTPSGVPTSWNIRGSGGGGALFNPQIAGPSDYYIASDMGQVFHSTNSGASWQTVDFRELQGGHESRVMGSGSTRYSIDYSGDSPKPTMSTDGGATWTPTTDPTGGGAGYLFADPTNANRVVLTSYDTLYFSSNGGSSWTAKYTAPNDGAGLLLGGAFWDGTGIYLGTNRGLLQSTNGGSTFSIAALGGIPTTQQIISFAGGKSDGATKFVAVTYTAADVYAGLAGYENYGGGQVYTLTLGQSSWVYQPLPAGTYPFFAGMARTNSNIMYVAGGDGETGHPTVVKSVNGAAWQDVLLTNGNQNIDTGWSGHGGTRGWWYGELAMGFTVQDTDPNHIIITDYGFAHASTDGGGNWINLNVSPADRNPAGTSIPPAKTYHDNGLDNTTAWQVQWAGDDNVIIANSDVRGQLSTDDGQTFGFGYSGHVTNSLYRVVEASNGKLYGATGTRHDLYQSTTLTDTINTATGDVIMSVDDGVTWTTIKAFNDVVSWVAVDPNNPNRLYASVVNSTAGGIWVTSNLDAATPTWTKLANPPRTEGHPFNIVVLNDGTLVITYSGRRDGNGVFTASSGVFVSINGGTSWIDRSHVSMHYWTKDIVVDPFDASQNTWYAGVFSGWGGPPNGLGGLYKTTDRGLTWNRILNLDRVTSCTFNLFDANELFVTTEGDGLWSSSNLRAATPVFSQVASYPFRQPERVFFNPKNADEIWVTSFGNGVMVGVNPPLAPTTVSTLTVNEGSTQRSRVTSLTLTFATPFLTDGLEASGVITLSKPGVLVQTGGDLGRITVAPMSGMTSTLTLTFSNGNNAAVSAGVEYGSLTDGRWQLSIPSLNYSAAVLRLFGDGNGDGTVDGTTDFAQFGNAFGQTAANSPFDFNDDGTVEGTTDFAQFGARFGKTI